MGKWIQNVLGDDRLVRTSKASRRVYRSNIGNSSVTSSEINLDIFRSDWANLPDRPILMIEPEEETVRKGASKGIHLGLLVQKLTGGFRLILLARQHEAALLNSTILNCSILLQGVRCSVSRVLFHAWSQVPFHLHCLGLARASMFYLILRGIISTWAICSGLWIA